MKIGIVRQAGFQLTGQVSKNWEVHSFTIARRSLSFSEILDSAFATPARYVQEMFVRLCTLDQAGQETGKFVFNPLFEINRSDILFVLGALREAARLSGIVVLVDKNDLPVGYLFPAWLQDADSRYLTLLSTVSGSTDAELLRHAFFTEVHCLRVNFLQLKGLDHNGFFFEGVSRAYHWVANQAVRMLKSRLPPAQAGETGLADTRGQRNAIPFTAIMPYHAGDALFFAIAYNNTATHFSRMVVNRTYRDIVAANAPGLETLVLDMPPNHRADNGQTETFVPDHAYFEAFQDTLPEDSFYYYCRPSRSYFLTEFHLVDHFAFALGYRSYGNAGLLFNSKPYPALFRPDIPAEPVAVLLHFDGGWPLKIYPRDLQERLIDLLHARGCRITVLAGSEYEHPKCTVTAFHGYTQFTELLKAHHILVGMDSFPCHYSAHVLGLPTICLFSCTRPENSNAPGAVNYAYLEVGLDCRPCSAVALCPLYRDGDCRNFVSPEVVANEIASMIRSVRSTATEPEARAGTATPPRPDGAVVPPALPEEKTATDQISMARLDLQILVAGVLLPRFRYPSEHYREFCAAVRREGILSAMRRTVRFIIRRFRSKK